MDTPIPAGYRIAESPDNLLHLDHAGDLVGLCRCGHLDTVHAGPLGQGACHVCACLQFTWVAFVTRKCKNSTSQT